MAGPSTRRFSANWKNILDDLSTHIFTGSVVSVESRWINKTLEERVYETIYSYVTIQVENYLKDNGLRPSNITLGYEGGVVGHISLRVFHNP